MKPISTVVSISISFLLSLTVLAQDYIVPVKKNTLWGYMDLDGQWIISDRYDDALPFSQGLASVQYYDKWGYINKEGDWVIEPKFNKAKPFSEGLASVYTFGKWGFINKEGDWVISPEYSVVSSFSDGFAVVFEKDGFQFINKRGDFINNKKYQVAKPFSEGLASVIYQGIKGYINYEGQFVFKHDYKHADTFSEGLAVVSNYDKFGFINQSGTLIIPLIFQEANHFSEGMACVKQKNKWGYADKSGQVVIPCDFEYAGNFENGYAVVRTEGHYGLINTYGEWILEPKFRDINEVGKPYSLEEELINLVSTRMNAWQRKGEFEKTTDYLSRVTEENRNEQLGIQTQLAINEMANKYIKIDLAELGVYNADAEVFTLYIPGMLSSLVPVPIQEAMWFKANWDKVEIVYPQFGLVKEKFILLHYLAVLDDHSYAYDAEEHGVNTSVFQVNPDLGDLEIQLSQYPITYFINQTGNKEETGLSEVDMNIPENPIVQSNIFALVIGNEDYVKYQVGKDQNINVDFAANDATIFSKYLNKTLGIPDENITLLINGTAGQIRQGLSKMKALAKAFNGEAEFIFYYAGHGLPDDEEREPYLIPVDVAPSDLKYAISLEEIYNSYTEHESKRVTLFLDACFSGGARNQALLASRGIRVRPKSPFVMGNLVVFSATRGDQTAYAYTSESHGLFTWHVLKKLKDTRGHLTYGEMAHFLDDEVNKRSLLVNDREQEATIKVSPILENTWQEFTFLNSEMRTSVDK